MRGAHVPCRATGLGDDQTQRCEIVDEGAEMAGRAARRSGQPRRALRHAAAAPVTVVEVGVDPAERLFGEGRAPPSMAPTAAAGRSPPQLVADRERAWEIAIKQALPFAGPAGHGEPIASWRWHPSPSMSPRGRAAEPLLSRPPAGRAHPIPARAKASPRRTTIRPQTGRPNPASAPAQPAACALQASVSARMERRPRRRCRTRCGLAGRVQHEAPAQ